MTPGVAPQQGRHRRVRLGRPGVQEEPEAGAAARPPEPLGQPAGDLVELHVPGGGPQPEELAPPDIEAGEELLHLHVLVPGGVVALGDGELPGPAGHGVLVQGDPDHPAPAGPAPRGGGTALEEPGDARGGERPEPGPEAVAAPGPAAPGEPAQAGIVGGLQVEDPPEADQGEHEAVEQAPGGHLDAGGRAGRRPTSARTATRARASAAGIRRKAPAYWVREARAAPPFSAAPRGGAARPGRGGGGPGTAGAG